MRVSTLACSLLLSPLLGACGALAPGANSRIGREARSLVGQNIQAAVALFGPPGMKMPSWMKFTSPGAVAEYDWTSIISQRTQWVQTGSVQVGSHMVGMTEAGNGVASQPIYEGDYAPVGQNVLMSDGCVIKIETDANDTILSTNVFGNACN